MQHAPGGSEQGDDRSTATNDFGVSFADVATHATDITAVARTDGALLWVSPSIEPATGWTPKELQGLHWQSLVHPGDIERLGGFWKTSGSRGMRAEHRLRLHAGGYRWFRTTLRVVWADSGEQLIVLGAHDVHDDVQQREQSRLSEMELRSLFDDIPDPVCEWRPIYNAVGRVSDLQVLRANRTFDAGFGGYSTEGRLASAFAPLAIAMIPDFEAALNEGRDLVREVTRSNRRYNLHISPTERSTLVTVAQEIIRSDPSDTNEITEQQQHLARMAHALRTNLSVVQGWTEILEDPNLLHDPALALEALHGVANTAKQALATVTSLLDSADTNHGHYRIPLDSLDIAPLLGRVAADSSRLSDQVRIDLRVAGPLIAIANAEAFDTVIRHLLDNAVRFANSTVEVIATNSGETIEVCVRDDGPGVADDVELFTPFTENHHGAGHGLGLNVVLKLVDAMCGRVDGGNRADGHGAQFVVQLPTAVSDQSESSNL